MRLGEVHDTIFGLLATRLHLRESDLEHSMSVKEFTKASGVLVKH